MTKKKQQQQIQQNQQNQQPKNEIPHLSFSQIGLYLSCPLAYYFRYKEGLKIRPDSALFLGSTFHKTVEKNYRQKIETKKDLKEKDITDIFSQEFSSGKKQVIWSKDEKPGKIKDYGINIVKTYHTQMSPSIQPAHVELECDIVFDDIIEQNEKGEPISSKPYPFTYRAVMDLVDDKETVIDHKVIKNGKSPISVATDLQLTSYSLAYRQIFGKPESKLRFDCIIKNKTPKIISYQTTRTDKEIQGLLLLMANVYDQIKNGIFYPNPKNVYCSYKKCGYWDLCRKKWWGGTILSKDILVKDEQET